MAKTEPVVLTKEQAEAIEWVSKNYGNPSAIRIASKSVEPYPKSWSKPETIALNGLMFDELARALYVGYTVEKTQEEREAQIKGWYDHIEKMYDASVQLSTEDKRADGMKAGITGTLRRLGITIEGVNA